MRVGSTLGRVAQGSARGVVRHQRWLTRSLRGSQTRLAAIYLLFLGLLIGIGAGYLLAPTAQTLVDKRPRMGTPVTPPPGGYAWVEVKTTGYCPCDKCCGPHADGRTAINRDVTRYPYGIAADRHMVPYKTWLFVPGYGHVMVDDTGVAMRRSAKKGIVHLDLRFKTHKQARQWGVRWLWIAMPEETQAARLAKR